MSLIEDINERIEVLTEQLHGKIVTGIGEENLFNPDDSFVIAASIANLAAWYAASIEQVSPQLSESFQNMIDRRIDLTKGLFKASLN